MQFTWKNREVSVLSRFEEQNIVSRPFNCVLSQPCQPTAPETPVRETVEDPSWFRGLTGGSCWRGSPAGAWAAATPEVTTPRCPGWWTGSGARSSDLISIKLFFIIYYFTYVHTSICNLIVVLVFTTPTFKTRSRRC